jgi:hypothetical protein
LRALNFWKIELLRGIAKAKPIQLVNKAFLNRGRGQGNEETPKIPTMLMMKILMNVNKSDTAKPQQTMTNKKATLQ